MSALDRTGTSRGYCRVPHCLARPVPHSLAAAVAAMSGGDAGSPPLLLRYRGQPGYTVPAHCSSVAAVVVTALSTTVSWAA